MTVRSSIFHLESTSRTDLTGSQDGFVIPKPCYVKIKKGHYRNIASSYRNYVPVHYGDIITNTRCRFVTSTATLLIECVTGTFP